MISDYRAQLLREKARAPLLWLFWYCSLAGVGAQGVLAQDSSRPELPKIPEVWEYMKLTAMTDASSGRGAFSYAGHEIAPVLHGRPGGVLRVDYVNAMSSKSTETCIYGPCKNNTNLHFHGLHVSPNSPQDDVIDMMAGPGDSLHYQVEIPRDQPPGLYWYHTHPHGESYQQDLDGMSGPIVIDGIERYVPEVRGMTEHILVLRDQVLESKDAESDKQREFVSMAKYSCGRGAGETLRLFTVNGVVKPSIPIAYGEKQFWRIVNASPDLYADVSIDGLKMQVVALDGMPLAFHDPERKPEYLSHVLLPPAGRVEAIVTGPTSSGGHPKLRTRCVNTGADGDPNPEMILADLSVSPTRPGSVKSLRAIGGDPIYKVIPESMLSHVESKTPDFTVDFTEDKHGFYINGVKYAPTGGPMTSVAIGGFHHWRIVNDSDEVHPFHIHQVHFLAYKRDGNLIHPAEWLDTVNVMPHQSLDLILDFTDPIIEGMSVFHCHLLKHEDKGMMAKIRFY